MSISNNTFIDLLDFSLLQHDLHLQITNNNLILPKQIIAGYCPVKDEIDIRQLLYRFSSNHRIALPVVRRTILIFKEWNFQKNEPDTYAEEIIPDIIFVPCTSMGKNGYRTGHGHKFYDKTIRLLRKSRNQITAIGVGYEYQLQSELLADKDSSQLDWILTPNQVIKCR